MLIAALCPVELFISLFVGGPATIVFRSSCLDVSGVFALYEAEVMESDRRVQFRGVRPGMQAMAIISFDCA